MAAVECVVEVMGLLIEPESVLRFSFGVRAQTEMKIWCIKSIYRTSKSWNECIGVSGHALQLHEAYRSNHVKTCISTTSHVGICIRYCKSCALHLNVQ